MRYFFSANIEERENDYTIQLPFNVWEVCKQREVITADMVLDNRIINCELLPKEKGNYEELLNKNGYFADFTKLKYSYKAVCKKYDNCNCKSQITRL